MAMAGAVRNLNAASAHGGQAESAEQERARALPADTPASPVMPSEREHATLDSRLIQRWIQRWRQLPPHVRRACVGAATAILGVAGYAGLIAQGDTHTPLASVGLLWHIIAGDGAYALAVLLAANGILLVAEGIVRRPLVRPHLFALALALWVVLEAALQRVFGGASGGMAGAVAALPLDRLPGPLSGVLLVAVAGVLPLALAGTGPRDVGRVIIGALRQVGSLHRPSSLGTRHASDPQYSTDVSEALGPGDETSEPPTAFLLPTAGFPSVSNMAVSWELPPLDLFDAPAQTSPPLPGLAKTVAERVERALASLGLCSQIQREDIAIGPSTIRVDIRSAERPRRDARGYLLVSRDGQPLMERATVGDLLQSQQALASALGQRRLRWETPAPGEPGVAFELPRADARPVSVYEVLLSDTYQRAAATSGLALALGRDTRGAAQALDLAAAPHMLLAGAKGAGVRTALLALIASLLASATPDDVRLLLLDSDAAPLATFDDVPHLLTPTVSASDARVGALRRLVEEAERRNQLFARLGVNDLVIYQHLAAQDDDLEWLPSLVMVVAELDDIAAMGARGEQMLGHLARVGRATGIHLVLATERPAPQVIPESLKALLPVRQAFAVTSPAESRSILDLTGAECLVGGGDALLRTTGTGRLVRMQAATINMEEVARLVRFWRRQTPISQVRVDERGTRAPAISRWQLEDPGDRPAMWGRTALKAEGMADSPESSRLPPLRRMARQPSPAGGSRAPVQRAASLARRPAPDDMWPNPLPEGWTDDMIEDMMQQIRSVIAQGRAPRASAFQSSEDEE
jgi:DNA segregation ATPase FtsK/SpoIIIE, S-DNA-T family